MNWGHGIALTVIGFIVFMSGLVFLCLQQDFYLVSDKYYEEGVAHDTRQLAESNYKNLDQEVEVSMKNDSLFVNIPTAVSAGSFSLYRPDDGNVDVAFDLESGNQTYVLDISTLKKGKWMLKLSWLNSQSNYYTEQSIFVQ